MPLETAWSSPFQDCSKVCEDSCMRCVEGDWLADLLVACVCGIKGISGEGLIFFFFFSFGNGFYGGKAFLFSFWKLSHMPLKKGRCSYSCLFFKVCIEQWL